MTQHRPEQVNAASKPSRRRVHRSRGLKMTARLVTAKADDLCLVSDISPFGAGVSTMQRTAPGDLVTLDFGDKLLIRGIVIWSAEGRCGITFDHLVDLAPLFLTEQGSSRSPAAATDPATPHRRASPRLRRCADVVIRHGTQKFGGRLFDVSQTGCRVDLAEAMTLARGDRVHFEIVDRIECEAVVCWSNAGSVGLEFDPPLRLWKLEKLLIDAMGRCPNCQSDACEAPSFHQSPAK